MRLLEFVARLLFPPDCNECGAFKPRGVIALMWHKDACSRQPVLGPRPAPVAPAPIPKYVVDVRFNGAPAGPEIVAAVAAAMRRGDVPL